MNKKKRIILVFAILLTLQVVIWLAIYLTVKSDLYFDDSLELAQTARSLLEGRGFSLLSYPLPGLDILHKYGLIFQDWPNLQKFPLPPFFLSFLFAIFGYTDEIITLSSAIPYFLILPSFFLLSLKILKADLLSTSMGSLLLIVNPVVVESSLIGQPEPGAIVLFLLFLTFILWKKLKHNYVFAGLIAALAYFNRQESILWISVAVLWIYFIEKRQIKHALMFFLAFIFASFPWWIYVASKVENPLFTLQGTLGIPAGTKTYPNFLYAEMYYVDPIRFIFEHPLEIFEKWAHQAWSFWRLFPLLAHIPLALAFFAVWLVERRDSEERKLKFIIITSFLAVLVFAFFYIPEIRYFIFFFPLVTLFGSKRFLEAISYVEKRKNIHLLLVIVFVVINSLGLVYSIRELRRQTSYRYERSELLHIRQSFSEDNVLISNLPRLVGWYSKKKVVTLPKEPSDIIKVEKIYGLKITGIYLVSPKLLVLLPVWERGWGEILKNKPKQLDGYTLVKTFSSGSLLYKKN